MVTLLSFTQMIYQSMSYVALRWLIQFNIISSLRSVLNTGYLLLPTACRESTASFLLKSIDLRWAFHSLNIWSSPSYFLFLFFCPITVTITFNSKHLKQPLRNIYSLSHKLPSLDSLGFRYQFGHSLSSFPRSLTLTIPAVQIVFLGFRGCLPAL